VKRLARLCAAPDCERPFVPSKYAPRQRFCSDRCRKRVWAYDHYDSRKRSERYWRLERRRALAAMRGHAIDQLLELEALKAAVYREAGLEPPPPERWVLDAHAEVPA
jgi:hypothetical protein